MAGLRPCVFRINDYHPFGNRADANATSVVPRINEESRIVSSVLNLGRFTTLSGATNAVCVVAQRRCAAKLCSSATGDLELAAARRLAWSDRRWEGRWIKLARRVAMMRSFDDAATIDQANPATPRDRGFRHRGKEIMLWRGRPLCYPCGAVTALVADGGQHVEFGAAGAPVRSSASIDASYPNWEIPCPSDRVRSDPAADHARDERSAGESNPTALRRSGIDGKPFETAYRIRHTSPRKQGNAKHADI
jgi:hypothetical protein